VQQDPEIADGVRAIRATWRIAMPAEDIALVARLLAGLPRPELAPSPPRRFAAAGRELVDLRRFVARARDLARDGELPLATRRQLAVFDELPRRVDALVERIEQSVGPFAEPRPGDRRSGVRQTYLVEVDPEEHASAHWMADLGHQASEAPPPEEPLGQMTLRAIAEDLREVERCLRELRAVPRLRRLAAEIATGCAELAGAIEESLPLAPSAPMSAACH
jgi:hypothetical protein